MIALALADGVVRLALVGVLVAGARLGAVLLVEQARMIRRPR
ncbi:hypothetical protein [Brachybacterium hainanense]|uniref:Uncharacterized protein n=1 Tax=Brachybacterium hainanense TaxID=1541174 RepID=A0ABV6R945_9MICO